MESNRIYWLFGDFKILNEDDPDYWHSDAKVISWAVDSNMIRFFTEEKDYGDGAFSIKVELMADRYHNFVGRAISVEDGYEIAKVECELFENSKKYLLKGSWMEGEENFTWILILPKK